MEVRSRFFHTGAPPSHSPAQSAQAAPAATKPVLFVSSTLFDTQSSLNRLLKLLGADYTLRRCESEARPLFGACDIFRAGASPVALTIVETSDFWLHSKERDQLCTRLTEAKARHRQSFVLAVDDESEDDSWRSHLDEVQQDRDRLRHSKLESCQLLRPGMKALQLLQADSDWPPLFMYSNIDELADRIVQLLAKINQTTIKQSVREASRRFTLNKSMMVSTMQSALPFLRPVEVSLLIDTYGSIANICAAFDDIDAIETELAIDRDRLVETYRVLNGVPAEYEEQSEPAQFESAHQPQEASIHDDDQMLTDEGFDEFDHDQSSYPQQVYPESTAYESEYKGPVQTQSAAPVAWTPASYNQTSASMDEEGDDDDDDWQSLVFTKR